MYKHDDMYYFNRRNSFKQNLPCGPGSSVYRIQYNATSGRFEYKEWYVTKFVITRNNVIVHTSPVGTLVHIDCDETLNEFIENTEPSIAEAEERVNYQNAHIDEFVSFSKPSI